VSRAAAAPACGNSKWDLYGEVRRDRTTRCPEMNCRMSRAGVGVEGARVLWTGWDLYAGMTGYVPLKRILLLFIENLPGRNEGERNICNDLCSR